MKTIEELNAVKGEAEAMNEKLHELTGEELEQVSGGVGCTLEPNGGTGFTAEPCSDGQYCLSIESTGKTLDIPGAGLNAAPSVVTYEQNGTACQKWAVSDDTNGSAFDPGSPVMDLKFQSPSKQIIMIQCTKNG